MIISLNPYSGQEIARLDEDSETEILRKIKESENSFKTWKKTQIKERAALMEKAADELERNKAEYAGTITMEMGKPITQAIAEIEKCAWVCRYYSENAEEQLAREEVKTDAGRSYISYEPLGPVLAIMPWNYPFWQLFRFAAPGLMAGNTVLLKHSGNVMLSAVNIAKVFERAGFPNGVFQALIIKSGAVSEVIKDSRVKAVTLTGSTAAGSAVASVAGAEIKKSVLELGGSNALLVFGDADLDDAVAVCVQARFQNTGQSCIAGKRLLIEKQILEEFTRKFTEKVRTLRSGDPMDSETYIGVLAREDLAETVEKQVKDSVAQGAKIILGGKRNKTFFEPTVLIDVTPRMPVFKEEVFGPVIGITAFESEEEAVELANSTEFGLGVSIFTRNRDRVERLVKEFPDGAVFVNELVISDPRLPFGGTKKSGFGRELSYHGIREFVNIKTVYLKNI